MKNLKIETQLHITNLEADYYDALERITKLEQRITMYEKKELNKIVKKIEETYKRMDQEDQYYKGVQ